MAFKDWQDTGNVSPLTLPIRDRDGQRREYTIPPLGYLDGIKLREEVARIASGEPGEMSNEEFLKMILGGQLQQMRDDNVPPSAIVHAASVAHVDALHGRTAAEKLWNEGPDPEALAAAMAALKDLADSTTSPATPPTAPTSSTKKPASTRSTRSPKASAKSSTGTTSSRSRG
jgi:hypothetical protein